MTTSNNYYMKIDALIENHSLKAKDAKPVGTYTTKQMIDLEHEWRLKLKKSGFSDIEQWDNRPKAKVKRIRFIKGHLRHHRYKKYMGQVPLRTFGKDQPRMGTPYIEATRFYMGFYQHSTEVFEYYRIIGLFSHHAPKSLLPDKYRKLLQFYATQGTCSEAIRKAAPTIKASAIEMYLKRNFKKMIAFVNSLERENDEAERTYDSRN